MTPTGRKDTKAALQPVFQKLETDASTVHGKVLNRIIGNHVQADAKADTIATNGPLMPARFKPHSTPHDGKVARSHSPRGAARSQSPRKL